jgi:two-component system sensor histidine kinase DegS
VDIWLRYTPEETVLTVKDNGVGVDLTDERHGRFGLIGIQERVQLLDGRIEIQTAPQQGFQFIITLPNN